jgi:hypothetical protein
MTSSLRQGFQDENEKIPWQFYFNHNLHHNELNCITRFFSSKKFLQVILKIISDLGSRPFLPWIDRPTDSMELNTTREATNCVVIYLGFPAFHGTQRFITAFTRALQLSLSWEQTNQVHPTPYYL